MTVASYFLSVVVPLSDDGDILEAFADDLLTKLREGWSNYEVVLVDDCSRDSTRAAALKVLERHSCVRYLRLSRRFGVEVAILAGMEGVIGDVVVVLEPESDPPALVGRFAETARASGGVVFGVRSTPSGQPLLYRTLRRPFLSFAARMMELELPEGSTLFMAFTRQTLNAIGRIRDKTRALRIFGALVGFQRELLPYEPVARRNPVRSKSVGRAIGAGASLIVNNSVKPLRYVAALGLFASFLNLVYLGYVIAIAVFKSHVAEGWVTQSATMSGMFLVLFAMLAVLAEYVGRLLEESRDRPAYFVAEERSSSVLIANVARRNVVHEST